MSERRILADDERQRAADVVAWLSVLVHSWLVSDLCESERARNALAEYGIAVTLPTNLREGVSRDA